MEMENRCTPLISPHSLPPLDMENLVKNVLLDSTSLLTSFEDNEIAISDDQNKDEELVNVESNNDKVNQDQSKDEELVIDNQQENGDLVSEEHKENGGLVTEEQKENGGLIIEEEKESRDLESEEHRENGGLVPQEQQENGDLVPIEDSAMASPSQTVRCISKTMVKPSPIPEGKRCPLTPWDLSMISLTYIEWGLVFSSLPPTLPPIQLIDRLKTSLSAALSHFYPLSGQLVTETYKDGLSISIDCNAGEGAEIIHAVADKVTVTDVLANNDNSRTIIKSLLPFYGAMNFDGHFLPLLAVQVTELADGIFLGCCANHAVVDGTAFWNFFSSWAKICQNNDADQGNELLSCLPIHDRWFINGTETPYKLPFTHPDEFTRRFSPSSDLRMRIFHFSSESTRKLKSQANSELQTNKISSYQALCSLMWRSVTRARAPQPDQTTTCRMASDERLKLVPPLGANYFGNSVLQIDTRAKVGDLLANGIGYGAQLLNENVRAHDDKEIRERTKAWMEAPTFLGSIRDPLRFSVFSSPRFPVYECDFGWGKPEAIRTGCMFSADGVVAAYPGREGGGSVEMEVYLKPETMKALESDEEFMSAVSQ